jgi:hypothetical protein
MNWRAIRPNAVLAWLAGVSAPWWIAGGWAIDLFLGQATRPHGDLDVGIFRRDACAVLAALPGWEVHEAKNGRLSRLAPGVAPRADVNCLWCRVSGETQWMLELLLDESDQDSWVYRRDSRIRRAVSEFLCREDSGLAVIAPEVQLLYKSKEPRTKDHEDFHTVATRLDSSARSWLRRSLSLTAPSHPWIDHLE